MQRDLDHAAVRDHKHVAVTVFLHYVVDGRRDSSVEPGRTLSTRHHVPVRLLDPRRPSLGKTLRYLGGRQPFPVAEEDLTQRLVERRGLADAGADDFGRLAGPLEVARVETREPPSRQTLSQEVGLAPAFRRKRGVELALDAVLLIPGGLAVANQDQACGSGLRG